MRKSKFHMASPIMHLRCFGLPIEDYQSRYLSLCEKTCESLLNYMLVCDPTLHVSKLLDHAKKGKKHYRWV